jgi:hypothetical protein
LGKDAAGLKGGSPPPGDEPEKEGGREPFLQLIGQDIRGIILL